MLKRMPISEVGAALRKDFMLARQVALNRSHPRDKATKVGCVIVSGDKRYVGSNIRRFSWNDTTCSERMALDHALADGITHIDRIVTYGTSTDELLDGPVSPCGSCRSIIHETLRRLGQQDVDIYLGGQANITVIKTNISYLLPLSESLKASEGMLFQRPAGQTSLDSAKRPLPQVRIMGMDATGKTTICELLQKLNPQVITFGSTPKYAYRWLETYGIGRADKVTEDQIDVRQHVFGKMNEHEAYLYDDLCMERPVVGVRGRADTWISANALRGVPMPRDMDTLFPKHLRPDLLVVLNASLDVVEERLNIRQEAKTGANSMQYHRHTQSMYSDLADIAAKHMPVLSFDTGRSSVTPELVSAQILGKIRELSLS